jgi:hypothetical protein
VLKKSNLKEYRKRIAEVKALMMKDDVVDEENAGDYAEKIFQAVNEFINNTDFSVSFRKPY